MAFDCNNQRKPLLFSDLFKTHRNTAPESSKLEGSSWSSSSTQFLSSCDSASSGFSTPLYSELGTSESEDGDFIAELTRQMAECMLQEEEEEEEEEENTVADDVSEASSPVKNNADENYAHSGADGYPQNGFYSSPVCSDDQMPPKTKVYQVKNQPPLSKEGHFCRGRRVKATESAQQKQIQKTDQQYMQYRGMRNGYSGSGMQAVFLGGSGPKIGPPGTGVFLPRDPAELKNKSGCSTVLIPTRVLQMLELHFSRLQDSTASPLSGGSPQDESTISNGVGNGRSDIETQPVDGDEMQLPQEWTY